MLGDVDHDGAKLRKSVTITSSVAEPVLNHVPDLIRDLIQCSCRIIRVPLLS